VLTKHAYLDGIIPQKWTIDQRKALFYLRKIRQKSLFDKSTPIRELSLSDLS
jgi:hypothetical protein